MNGGKYGEEELAGAGARTECAEVEVLVAGDAADARLPPPLLVVPSDSPVDRSAAREPAALPAPMAAAA